MAVFHNVSGSAWEREAALQHNRSNQHLLVDTMLRWWATGIWLVIAGDRMQNDWGFPMWAKLPIALGAILLTMGMTPLAGYVVLKRTQPER